MTRYHLGDEYLCADKRYIVTSILRPNGDPHLEHVICTPIPEGMTEMDLGRRFDAAVTFVQPYSHEVTHGSTLQ